MENEISIIKEVFQVAFAPILILIFLLIFVTTSSLSDKKLSKRFTITILLVFILIIVDSIEYYLSFLSYPTIERVFMDIIAYTLRPIIVLNIILLVHSFSPKNIALLFIPCIVVFLVSLTALFSDIAFRYDENNNFVRGPLGYVPHITSFLYLGVTLYYSIARNKEKSIIDNSILITLVVSIVASTAIQMIFKIEGIINIAMMISIAFYYLHINVQAYKRDILTGALNRHSFYLDSLKIEKNLLAIISMDLNDLKVVNDTLGHQEGDKLLINIANIFNDNMVNGCRLYRIGGDEFIMLVTNKVELFELHSIVNNINCQLIENNFSCAIGVAYVEDENESFDSVLKRADSLMYEDKANKKALLNK